MVSRRKFCQLVLGSTSLVLVGNSWAESNIISKSTLKKSKRKTWTIDVARKKYWEIRLDGLDTTRIVFKSGDDEILLKDAISRYKLGRKGKFMIANNARNFPDISSASIAKIEKLPRDGFITVDSDVPGVCINYTIGLGGIYLSLIHI